MGKTKAELKRELDEIFGAIERLGNRASGRCPYCMESVDAKATRCPHCTSKFLSKEAATSARIKKIALSAKVDRDRKNAR